MQRTVNEGTARKKVRLLLSSEMIAVFVILSPDFEFCFQGGGI